MRRQRSSIAAPSGSSLYSSSFPSPLPDKSASLSLRLAEAHVGDQ